MPYGLLFSNLAKLLNLEIECHSGFSGMLNG